LAPATLLALAALLALAPRANAQEADHGWAAALTAISYRTGDRNCGSGVGVGLGIERRVPFAAFLSVGAGLRAADATTCQLSLQVVNIAGRDMEVHTHLSWPFAPELSLSAGPRIRLEGGWLEPRLRAAVARATTRQEEGWELLPLFQGELRLAAGRFGLAVRNGAVRAPAMLLPAYDDHAGFVAGRRSWRRVTEAGIEFLF
jgi:hypothetical protein